MKALNTFEIQAKLKELDGWEYNNDSLQTTIEFTDFKDAFSVMTRIAFEAEKLNHHPDWANSYNVLNITLTTHEAKGLTENDFILAKCIDNLIS